MKNSKGFIQIPLLIAIIAGILVLGGAGYFGWKQIKNHPVENTSQTPANSANSGTTTPPASEIDQLKQEVEDLKKQVKSNQASNQKATNANISQDLSSSDIQPYLDTVGVVTCFDTDNNEYVGTAILYKTGQLLTNWHVVSGMDTCLFVNDKFMNPKYEVNGMSYRSGAYILDLANAYKPNAERDFAIVPFSRNEKARTIAHQNGAPLDEYLEVNQLDYRVGTMTRCSQKATVGTSVAIVGYPASSVNLEQFAPPESVTTGIISGYDASYGSSDYLVSAKVDHGNSGGLALAKENGKVCFLGIPTWVVTGQVESAGIIQNINNLLK